MTQAETTTPDLPEMEPEEDRLFDVPPKTTEDVPTIHQRMVAILAELPAIGKDSVNTQQKFKFRSHDDVLNALNPLLAKHGVYVVPEVVDREATRRETRGGTIMYEVNLLVRYYFIGEGGDQVVASAWGEGTDMGDKSTNKAMTMAFKNVLAQSFAVSTAETVDADAETPEETVAAGTAAAQAERERQEQAAREREETRDARLRARIEELCAALDEQTSSEAGTFASLVSDATVLAFETPYDSAPPATLEEIGRSLKAMKDFGVTEAPAQLELR
jgi:hypothetical protein